MRTLIQRILRSFSSFEKWEVSSSDFYSIVRRVFEWHTVSTFPPTFEKRFRSTEIKPRSQLFSSMFSSLIQPRFDTYHFGVGQTEKSQTTPVHGRPKKRRTYWAAVARPTFSFGFQRFSGCERGAETDESYAAHQIQRYHLYRYIWCANSFRNQSTESLHVFILQWRLRWND